MMRVNITVNVTVVALFSAEAAVTTASDVLIGCVGGLLDD